MEGILDNINSLRDEPLDLLEKLEEQRAEVIHMLRNTPAITLQDLKQTLRVYCSLRDNVLSMLKNMDFLEEALINRLHHT